MLVTFLSLLCPSGVNATQIISREAGLDTQKLDFIFCSYFILENFFFQNQSIIGSLVFSECRMLAFYFLAVYFFFLLQCIIYRDGGYMELCSLENLCFVDKKNQLMNPRFWIVITAYSILRPTYSQGSDHTFLIDFPEIYFALLENRVCFLHNVS